MKRVTLILMLFATPALAQTRVDFAPSPDHDVQTDSQGPKLTSYAYTIRVLPANGVIAASSMGKPTPATVQTADGPVLVISFPVPEFSGLSHQLSYTVSIKAVGPGGESAELTSDPFLGPPKAATAPAAAGKPTVK